MLIQDFDGFEVAGGAAGGGTAAVCFHAEHARAACPSYAPWNGRHAPPRDGYATAAAQGSQHGLQVRTPSHSSTDIYLRHLFLFIRCLWAAAQGSKHNLEVRI